MNFDKVMKVISNLEDEFKDLIAYTINGFLQEIIDPEDVYHNGEKDISTHQIMMNLKDEVGEHLAEMLFASAVEFCMTNFYPHYGKDWNCINHIKYHAKNLETKETQYLEALNASHMSIYKVILVFPGKSIVIQDKVAKKSPKIAVIDKSLSFSVKKGQYIGVRVIQQNKQYQLTSSVFVIPNPIVKDCIDHIRVLTTAMSNPATALMFGNEDIIEDNDHYHLLVKKMWVKEIAEDVYDYYVNYQEYHDILDMDGNPWLPCVLEFKLNASMTKVRTKISSLKDIIPNFIHNNKDEWIWCDKEFKEKDKRNLLFNLSDDYNRKIPVLNGQFIKDEYDGKTYNIFASISLVQSKLKIYINSSQRANIVQMKFSECLGDLISDPVIYSVD